MYRARSIKLFFEDHPKQSIDIAFGGDDKTIALDCNSDPEDPYAGAYVVFDISEFREFIAACQEALDKKLEE